MPSDDPPPPEAGTCYAAARLRLLHDEARPGRPRREALAALTDDWLRQLFDAAVADTGVQGAVLAAVGGYGRGELSPRSDLDLLLLHDGASKEAVAALAERLWYPVWDLGLDLDHSVRTPTEARRIAADDLKVHLGLLDARPVAGDHGLLIALRTTVLADWRNHAVKRLPELAELCRERGERHGELQYLLEGDLKESRGGLRDATALRAVAASWLADAPRQGLDQARTRLLDVRDALHLTTGRATDRLALQEQDGVAASLELPDADALLRRVYGAARTISYASDVTWREVNRVLRARSARPRLRAMLGVGGKPAADRVPLADGVVEQEGEAVLARTARPERDPVLPLRAAAAAAQAGVPISPYAVRRLAASAPPMPVPWPAEAREELVTLLGAGEPTVPVWEALEAEGVIGRLLPDWERVHCRPQRNPVHTWTVDRHLVETAVRAASLTRRVSRPDLLLICALLHDLGKGWPGDHSVTGETIARDTAARIGFDAEDTRVIATVVRHHLLLIDTATRRDLDDPATVAAVAGHVRGDGAGHVPGRITLELLHALTEADALATGPAAWSAWRAGLVADLVARVDGALAGEPVDQPDPGAPSARQERLAVEALRTGGPVVALRAEHDDGAADAFRAENDDGAAAVAGIPGSAGGRGAAGVHAESPVPEPVGVELHIAVPERPGVLPAAAGVLALHRLTVRAADLRAVELPTGIAGSGATADILLLSWRVAAAYGSLPEEARLRADLVRVLDGTLDITSRLAERDAAYPRRRGTTAPPPRVTVAGAASREAAVIEVRAQDAPGLLYRIGRALETSDVRVRSAHVSTLGANAVDTVYVTRPDGTPLPAEDAEMVAKRVQAALTAG